MILVHSAAQLVTPLSSSRDQFLAIVNGAIASEGEKIIFVGTTAEGLASFPNADKIDASGKVILPGFVDPHTHLIFGGNRCEEFLMRLRGASYQEIATAGGGIQSTVRATRSTTAAVLLESARRDLQIMFEHGTTTVEVKSGYGLDWENERKLLEVANQLEGMCSQDLAITFLGAHDFPKEKSHDAYLADVLNQMLPAVARNHLAEFCDVFCDEGYYTVEQARAISLRATQLGMKVKLHVDELADVQGAALAAEVKAVSADHLILANEDGIRKLAEAQVCAVLLPGTSIGLKGRRHAPARKMIESGIRVAIGTDFNPGTCYCHSMQFILQLATFLYGLTAEEAIRAATLNAAAAIARDHSVGSLEVGKQMDCLILDIPHYGYLLYNLGVNRLEIVVKKGKIAWSKKQDLT